MSIHASIIARPSGRRRAWAFVAAWLTTAVWGSVVQTQFNLAALTGLGVPVPLPVRLVTTVQDVATFGGIYAAIVLAGWLPAFAVAGGLSRRRPEWRVALFAMAACMGLIAAIRAVDAFAPMPVFIDATRSATGLLTMSIIGLPAGALFALRTGPTRHRVHPPEHAAA